MKNHFITALRMTAVTTVLLGLIYPLTITAISQAIFPDKANGQIVYRNGKAIGSRIIGQPFTGPGYFHSRPSAAGSGYDATSSGGSNLAPTNKKFIDAVEERAQFEYRPEGGDVPIDLATASGSGLDPDVTPAAAYYQIGRVAQARGMDKDALRQLVDQNTEHRELGFLGEARVNVLELNLALDRRQLSRGK